jgi:hypothetical protein
MIVQSLECDFFLLFVFVLQVIEDQKVRFKCYDYSFKKYKYSLEVALKWNIQYKGTTCWVPVDHAYNS